jgi:ribonuclease HII
MKKPLWVIGIDEVGRGPVAGPVAVCATAMRIADYKKVKWGILTDSKKMTAKGRASWYQEALRLRDAGKIRFSVVYRSNAFIDKKGISRAIRECIAKALKDIQIAPEECAVLLDGSLKAPKEYTNQKTIIQGDQKEKVISLASVIAKVSRDTKMEMLHKKYPQYHWKANKGYGTALHYKAMWAHGLTLLHRKTFLTKIKK